MSKRFSNCSVWYPQGARQHPLNNQAAAAAEAETVLVTVLRSVRGRALTGTLAQTSLDPLFQVWSPELWGTPKSLPAIWGSQTAPTGVSLRASVRASVSESQCE